MSTVKWLALGAKDTLASNEGEANRLKIYHLIAEFPLQNGAGLQFS
jgi:hypothetical protein